VVTGAGRTVDASSLSVGTRCKSLLLRSFNKGSGEERRSLSASQSSQTTGILEGAEGDRQACGEPMSRPAWHLTP